MATSDKTKKLQLLGGGFATKKQLEEQYLKTYVLDEGETAEDAPEWAEEVIDPFSESEGGSGVTREEFDRLSEAIAELKSAGIIAVQDGDTLTIENVETENVEEVESDG